MSPTTLANNIEAARREVTQVLRRYGVGWQDVAPDRDEAVWKRIVPAARRIRKQIFRARYPTLYEASRRRKKA